jgi:hypothetical protein
VSEVGRPTVKLAVPAPADFMRGLSDWAWLMPSRFAPVAVNRFGDWYILTPDGAMNLLSIWEGTFAPVAPSHDAWVAWLSTDEGMKTNWCKLVLLLYDRGHRLQEGECFAFAPQVMFGAALDVDEVKVMSTIVITSIAGQTFRQISGAR